jgi:hypothetical protein
MAKNQEERNEENISAQQQEEKEQARVPVKDVHEIGPSGIEETSCERAPQAYRQR